MSTEKADVFFVRAVTPIHIGVDVGLGAVNLPTMREAITRHPVIPGSSFKGVLRDLQALGEEQSVPGDADSKRMARWAAFGPSRLNASDYRGGLVISDARVLLLPIPSLKGTFTWATSHGVLRRYARELRELQLGDVPRPKASDKVLVTHDTKLLFDQSATGGGARVSLREMLIDATQDANVDALAASLAPMLWSVEDRPFFTERLAVLPDEVFDAFARSPLELRARVAIDSDRGTAMSSGPWTEEHVPAEAVFVGVVMGRRTDYRPPATASGADSASGTTGSTRGPQRFDAEAMLGVFHDAIGEGRTMRIGGHSSVGLGRVRITRRGDA